MLYFYFHVRPVLQLYMYLNINFNSVSEDAIMIDSLSEEELEKFNKNGGATSVWTWKESFKQVN